MKILLSITAIMFFGLVGCSKEPGLLCDFNGDGIIDGADMALFREQIGGPDLRFDLDSDGVVGPADYETCASELKNG